MIRKYFGTDGIRGCANQEPMTADTAMRVAMAAGCVFRRGDHRHRVVIGKDTRLSGYLLEPALTAGFIAVGMDVILVGPLPTPAVSMLAKSLRADLGVMISASHNPYQDNGIKLFGPDGEKLSDALELEIEALMDSDLSEARVASNALGKANRLDDASGRYVEYVKATFPGNTLNGLKIVVDCANGAAYKVAPTVLWELGAEVIPLAVTPNGRNINDRCGATCPQLMQEAILLHQADLGLALDGDADRLIMADENGRQIDGDQLMALIACSWAKRGGLKNKTLVATVMSNLGLERFLVGQGIALHRTRVGDRYVAKALRETGSNVGGEQSGHIILNDYSATGDGLVAALQVLAVIQESGRAASEVCSVFKPVPQVLENVRARGEILDDPVVKKALADAENKLGDEGRLVVRKSGTEPLIRVMGEGDDEALVRKLVLDLCQLIEKQEKKEP
ncbi:MAG: phosphoglucosamine mutase [Alphaproteobacteria bacterium]|nr:phosphoglucosamine mutase [Alphaproteobacteria bacterium]